MIPDMAGITIPAAVVAALLTLEGGQIAFQAVLLRRVTTVETKVEERTEPAVAADGGEPTDA